MATNRLLDPFALAHAHQADDLLANGIVAMKTPDTLATVLVALAGFRFSSRRSSQRALAGRRARYVLADGLDDF